ncbi:streptomycin biosynthesis protein [Kitasatospora sp. NPDC057015]|uniref:streptomycin biosynthesis protein n=1 Tax=Kitasatospora sp. NPDC057015 TaxID=3346001 RepID=UPI0036283E59
MAIDQIVESDSLRSGGLDEEHVRMLADSGAPLPPIIVDRATMRVLDGAHRLRAATLRGRRDIEVEYFVGEPRDAFVLAVNANIAHGLPLSQADRATAAARIMLSHPEWSNRAIALVAGLSHQAVGEIRRRATGQDDRLHSRVGRDGRVRPLDSAGGRRRAGELIAEDPGASLRTVARLAGISPGTVRDVRERLRRGEDPVPQAGRPRRQEDPLTVRSTGREPSPAPPSAGPSTRDTPEAVRGQDVSSVLNLLRNDPSLRFSEAGRALLRLLHAHASLTAQSELFLQAIPAHSAGLVANVALEYAGAWQRIAERLRFPGEPGGMAIGD